MDFIYTVFPSLDTCLGCIPILLSHFLSSPPKIILRMKTWVRELEDIIIYSTSSAVQILRESGLQTALKSLAIIYPKSGPGEMGKSQKLKILSHFSLKCVQNFPVLSRHLMVENSNLKVAEIGWNESILFSESALYVITKHILLNT